MGGVAVAKRKVLYLLHGLSDDASAWQRYSCVETLATAYGLVVVMPSAGRSFYIDQPNGQGYFTYLTEELPHYLADVFGLAPRREDTFIAGNSMGGHGAFKAALLHPELYAASGRTCTSRGHKLRFFKELEHLLSHSGATPSWPRWAKSSITTGKSASTGSSPCVTSWRDVP